MAEKAPPKGELGSALSHVDSLFGDFTDETSLATSPWEARDLATMLRTESQARKVESVLTLPILAAPQHFEPAKGDKGEAEWLTEVLTRPANAGGMSTPLRTVIAQATTAITYRVASFEKVWAVDELADRPQHVYDKLAFRPAVNTRVIRDRKTGAYKGLEQDRPYGGTGEPVKIKPDRAWTYVHGTHRSPVIGTSDMEIPLTCWRSKQKLRFLWFLHLELHAMPRTMVTAEKSSDGPQPTANDVQAAARKLARMRGGGAAGMPPGVTASILETANGRANDLFMQAMKYLDSEMTGQVLAQFADLASAAADGKGSLALSRDQSDLFMLTRRWAADELAESFTSWVAADLIRHKFGPRAAVPRLTIGPLVSPDLSVMMTALKDFGAQSVPAEFVAFVVEQTAAALGMKPDRAAQLVKATTEAHRKAAQTPRQDRVAGVTGPLAAAEKIVRKAAEKDREVAKRARAAAGRAADRTATAA